MVEATTGGGSVLNDQEQRVWDDVQRFWAETAEETAAERRAAAYMRARARRAQGDAPGWVAASAWIAIFLVLFGATVAGLALGAATVLGWALWRYWPELTGQAPPAERPSSTGSVQWATSRQRSVPLRDGEW
jgi:hypothetical protein